LSNNIIIKYIQASLTNLQSIDDKIGRDTIKKRKEITSEGWEPRGDGKGARRSKNVYRLTVHQKEQRKEKEKEKDDKDTSRSPRIPLRPRHTNQPTNDWGEGTYSFKPQVRVQLKSNKSTRVSTPT